MMLKGIITSVIGIAITGFVTIAQAEEYNVNPGMWETTYKMEVSGNIDFSPDDMAKECNFKSTRHSASKVSWDIQCQGQNGNSTGHGEVNFNGDSARGWFEMNMQSPMGPMKIRNDFEGKRTGPC